MKGGEIYEKKILTKLIKILQEDDEYRHIYTQTLLRRANFWNNVSKFKPLEKFAARKWLAYYKLAHYLIGISLAKSVSNLKES